MFNRNSLPKRQRNIHIHECQRRELASTHGRLQSKLHYCFQCFNWFDEGKWDDHRQLHLSLIASKRCGSTIYCNTTIRPAYCPFCLNEVTPSASSRLQSWTRDCDLWGHLETHIEKSRWPSSCPHPLCDLQLNDEESFYYHLSDIHSLRRRGNGHNRALLNGLNGSEEWEKIFRTRIDLLSMHAMMLRSETMRYAELPDLCSLRLDNEGPHCLAVIQQITRGKMVRREDGGDNWKTNYHGYRWDLAGETPPDFRDRASWYGKKLTPASLAKPEVEISHSTQGAWVNRVFALVGIFVSVLLHAPRKAAARWADL
jgi:hypothetical protein